MTYECFVRARVRLGNALKMYGEPMSSVHFSCGCCGLCNLEFDKLKFSAQYKLLSVLAIWL